jgi:hypothetical protein
VNRTAPTHGRTLFTVHCSLFTLDDGSGSGLVVWPVFKTAMEAPSVAPVGSIPTRSRHPRSMLALFLCTILLVAALAPVVAAQDSTAARRRAAPVQPDTASRRYISPFNALWRSLLVPGWGQARLNRKLAGGIFVGWEGVTLGMTLKTRSELRYLRRVGSTRGDDKRQEHEDWLVLLAFNHLFAGLEAYVSAHLADFPGDLRFQAVPGGMGASVSLPIRVR